TLFGLIKLAIVVRILMSWFRPNPSHPIYQLTVGISEPILRPLRKIMPRTGMFDFSPIIALIGLDILNSLILQLIYRLPPF
ncbi:MAG: YggT family protein, partial [Candidatus Gracilibacteria bacterium]